LGGALLFGIAGIGFQWSVKKALHREFDDYLRQAGRALEAFVEEKEGRVKMKSDVDDILDYRNADAASFFVLREADGQELKRSLSLDHQTLPLIAPKADKPIFFNFALAGGRRFRCLAVSFEPGVEKPQYPGEKGRAIVLINGRDRRPLEATLKGLQRILVIAGVSVLAGLTVLLWWGVRLGLRPLDRVVSDISSVDAKTLATRFSGPPLPAELQPIAIRLNELLERLDTVFQREKRFTGAVAHELRTPLAELRTLAEVNLMVPAKNVEENAACWAEVRAVSERMESLALRLLEVARVEQGAWPLKAEIFRVEGMIEAAWQRVASVAVARKVTLERDFPASWKIASDPALFELIVTNLVDNALHHATAGTVLRISGGGASLHFVNEVSNLAPGDISLLFERFWKKDSARSDSRRHGLGLALSKDIAVLLGGSLIARMPTIDLLELVLNL